MRKRKSMVILTILMSLIVGSTIYGNEPLFDLTLKGCAGPFYLYANQAGFKLGFVSVSPMIAYRIPMNLKVYLGGNLEAGPGILAYLNLGIGSEFKFCDAFSIEPIGLIDFGGYYQGSLAGVFSLLGFEGFFRFNIIFNQNFKIFFEPGLKIYTLTELGQIPQAYTEIPHGIGITFSW